MNWLIMYQLNPNDFRAIYEDVVIYEMGTWKAIVEEIFGSTSGRIGKGNEESKEND